MKTYAPRTVGAPLGFSHTKPLFIVDNFTDFHGPTTGVVTLPLHLDWTPASTYDLSKKSRLRTMYATVLREAGDEITIARWINAELLQEHWIYVNVSCFIRDAWEKAHPQLKQNHQVNVP